MRASPRLLVAAAHKSSGKTTLTLGLAAALRERGHRVRPFKKGPDYIDPMWLARAAGRDCINLDLHLMTGDEVDAAFVRACAGPAASGAAAADLALIEGNHGLFDGLSLDGRDSNAALARRLQAPVLLVIDVRGMTRGIAPLLLGYLAFDKGLRIGGVVLNRVGGARHETKLRAVVEHYTDLPVLGCLADDPALAVTERHLGLMPAAEVADADARIRAIARRVAEQIDLDAVVELAQAAPALPMPARAHARVPEGRVRIAIARDRAFGFYYADDLAALESAGATLLPFDTLHDTRLPDADGLLIGGGFPETCLEALEANASLRAAIREALAAGMPAYAECGGLMYLARRIEWNGRSAEMVGAIPGDAVMHARPVGRGYVELEETAAMPWVAGSSATVRGHEFHHSSLERLDPGVGFAYRVRRGHGVDGRHDGVVVGNLLASYAHRRQVGGDAWATRFIDHVRRVATRRTGRGHAAAAH